MEFFTHPQNMMFFIGYCIIALFLVIEVFGLIIGFSLMSLTDELFDVGANTEAGATGVIGVLTWFNLHRVPFMVWLCLFLFFFSSSGYILNHFSAGLIGYVVPNFITIPAAGFVGLVAAKTLSVGIANVIPKNESYHIEEDEYTEYTATITVGVAKQDLAARAAFTDKYNTRHSILVKPLPDSPEIQTGQQVVLVEKQGNTWLVAPLLTSE